MMSSATAAPAGRLVLLMGMAGTGKTTLGRALAARLRYAFLDADDFHSIEAIALMRSGVPLPDAMRDAWVDRLQAALTRTLNEGVDVVLAFSGLRARHRRQLIRLTADARAFMLHGDPETLTQRMARREGHFMPASQVPDQLKTMQPIAADERIHPLDAEAPPDAILAAIERTLAAADR